MQRRNPRLTRTFDSEAEARVFARTKFDGGLIVNAGTKKVTNTNGVVVTQLNFTGQKGNYLLKGFEVK